jgi:hypothetical protein
MRWSKGELKQLKEAGHLKWIITNKNPHEVEREQEKA